MVLVMCSNVSTLEKKAIKLALKENWEDATSINQEILEIDPENLKAKIRLGRAYLQLKDFNKAEKLFKEVLVKDPINLIAKKNFELAKKKKTKNTMNVSGKALVKEPGTTCETVATLTANRIDADDFAYGAEFKLKILKTKISLLNSGKVVGVLVEEPIIKTIQKANKNDSGIQAMFIGGNGKDIKVLVRCKKPVFKGDKQDVKPYLKKGSIEEPEIEIDSFDDE